MNFLTSGFIGLGANIAKEKAPSISAESAKAILGISRPDSKPLFGFTDKLLITLALTMIGIAAVRKAIK